MEPLKVRLQKFVDRLDDDHEVHAHSGYLLMRPKNQPESITTRVNLDNFNTRRKRIGERSDLGAMLVKMDESKDPGERQQARQQVLMILAEILQSGKSSDALKAATMLQPALEMLSDAPVDNWIIVNVSPKAMENYDERADKLDLFWEQIHSADELTAAEMAAGGMRVRELLSGGSAPGDLLVPISERSKLIR